MNKRTIACIGCGNMGGAMLGGWLSVAGQRGYRVLAMTRTPARAAALAARGLELCETAEEAARQADILVLAVKPYQVEDVLARVAPALGPETILVSVAAGVSVERLRTACGGRCPVVRCMPNTPALVGKGVFALCFDDPSLKPDARERVQRLFADLGVCVELPEGRMTAFSALVGAGPAYVFQMMQGLVQAGVTQGFSWAQSRELVAALFEGCACMARQETTPLMEMRDNVCSPAGLTIAGVNVLDRAGLSGLLVDAVLTAEQRGREMETK
ncbi:pyrroline-5-carboxylate reductase [uncultured Desulfovibrio sp.]|uniref:pyrroline-5-carboxylate reductase n=1 Tax=uncultured Desulfovibrio sp. TaxID=167968 RepID=UPI0026157C1F|nr:pyrroline-5-carboxylate reductase [uncultured Desulfovibrio sp.]